VGRRLLGRGLWVIRVGINSRRFDRQACEMTVAQTHGAMLEGVQEQKKSGVPQVQGGRLLKEGVCGPERTVRVVPSAMLGARAITLRLRTRTNASEHSFRNASLCWAC
jgi:hypothetical protein